MMRCLNECFGGSLLRPLMLEASLVLVATSHISIIGKAPCPILFQLTWKHLLRPPFFQSSRWRHKPVLQKDDMSQSEMSGSVIVRELPVTYHLPFAQKTSKPVAGSPGILICIPRLQLR
ncbi:hypothetical protein HRR83_006288 [Exophiala dermatitidis]|uniref:Uncharacterized protein n=1 Tax=Exophiala dermatitidis TaxID=5970 RepID=A0AAN6ENM1_EXODE|nr:hypothetical protein HRR73_007147 [Exophiala dermatitidis]KAJ4509480.1 hypothetical protein HRR74_007261 [Exophiala dermatitidis]KAJ4530479.1 hypothetical protein HRR76_008188 [Exophiala dermatitidis]KAJ4545351.1 hypothetical protein HRR77_005198 [Exophiala dermatitidis]KAJ4570911.1 hypothetical protein HRR79_003840 [Exophiala dermatitidis]